MARTLVYTGLLVLAVGAWLVLAEEFGWVGAGLASEAWFPILARAGGAMLVAGLVIHLVAPLGRALRGSRCVRCRRAVERGQTYCADHLRATVNEYQDAARRRGVI